MSGTKPTYVLTKNNRISTRQDKRAVKKILEHLVTTETFRNLTQENPAYKDVYTILNMWIHRDGIDLDTAHSMVTGFTKNKYMPTAPTNIFEVANALFNQDVIDQLDLVIYYNHDNEYSVNFVTENADNQNQPGGNENLDATQDTLIPGSDESQTPQSDVTPQDQPKTTIFSEDSYARGQTTEGSFVEIRSTDKHGGKLKKVGQEKAHVTPVKNVFHTLSDDDEDDDDEAGNDEDSNDRTPKIYPTKPKSTRAKLQTKSHTTKNVTRNIATISKMIASGKSDELTVEEVAYCIEHELDQVVDKVKSEIKGLKNNAKREIKAVHNTNKLAYEDLDRHMTQAHHEYIKGEMAETQQMLDERTAHFREENAAMVKTLNNMKNLSSILRGSTTAMKNEYTTALKDEVEQKIRKGDTFLHRDAFVQYQERVDTNLQDIVDEMVQKEDYDEYRRNIAEGLKQIKTDIEDLNSATTIPIKDILLTLTTHEKILKTSKTTEKFSTQTGDTLDKTDIISRQQVIEKDLANLRRDYNEHTDTIRRLKASIDLFRNDELKIFRDQHRKVMESFNSYALRQDLESVRKEISDYQALKSEYQTFKRDMIDWQDEMTKWRAKCFQEEMSKWRAKWRTDHQSTMKQEETQQSHKEFKSGTTNYTVLADDEEMPHGTRIRYQTGLMTSSQTGYIKETLEDSDGNKFFSVMTNSNTNVVLNKKSIVAIENRPANSSSEHVRNHMPHRPNNPYNEYYPPESHDKYTFDPYRPPYEQQGQRGQRTQMFRENDYLEYNGEYTSMKRVDEQGLNALTAIQKSDDLIKLGKHNAEDFYTRLRLFLIRFGIPLLDWHHIQTPKYNIIDLNPETTRNYMPATKVMTRAMFRFFQRFTKDLFDNTTHFPTQLTVFQPTIDGLAFLREILTMCHPKLNRNAIYSTSVGATLRPPRYDKDTGVYKFLQESITYFKNNDKEPLVQVKFVQEELQPHAPFKSALTVLNEKLQPYIRSDTGFVDEEITLPRLPQFFMSYMSPEELLQVGGNATDPSNASITTNKTDVNDIEVSAVTTRSKRDSQRMPNPYNRSRQQDNRQREEDQPSRKEPIKKTKHCPACGTYGHTEDTCPVAGKVLHVTEWLERLPSAERREFLKAYKKNRLDTHRRYLEGKRSRKNLKMRINAISINNAEDHNLDSLICCAIADTRKTSPSLDFGSLDNTYADMSEPELDDDVDEWPEYDTISPHFE